MQELNPYPLAFSEEGLPGKAFQQLEIFILVHFVKENYLEKPCGSCNPYPSAFYEGELPGEACGSCNPYPSAFYEGELPGEALRELQSLS